MNKNKEINTNKVFNGQIHESENIASTTSNMISDDIQMEKKAKTDVIIINSETKQEIDSKEVVQEPDTITSTSRDVILSDDIQMETENPKQDNPVIINERNKDENTTKVFKEVIHESEIITSTCKDEILSNDAKKEITNSKSDDPDFDTKKTNKVFKEENQNLENITSTVKDILSDDVKMNDISKTNIQTTEEKPPIEPSINENLGNVTSTRFVAKSSPPMVSTRFLVERFEINGENNEPTLYLTKRKKTKKSKKEIQVLEN